MGFQCVLEEATWQGAGRPMSGNMDFSVTSWSMSNSSRSFTWMSPTTAYLHQPSIAP